MITISKGLGNKSDKKKVTVVISLGGPRSGNYGHDGRPGVRGGSGKGGGLHVIGAVKEMDVARVKKFAIARRQRKGEGYPKAEGMQTQAFGNDPNVKYKFATRVVSLNSLITSNTASGGVNPDYDQTLQPRDRSRAASQAQIDNVARNLVPESILWDFHALDKGTPIIGEDGMVESGNGRMLALMRAKELYPEKFAEYQASLRKTLGEYGLNEADIAGIENPVLVRVRQDDSIDRVGFAKEANSAAVLQMSPMEQAEQDARLLNEKSLGKLAIKEDQNIEEALRSRENQPFVRDYVSGLPANERAVVMRSDGSLNRMGIWRLKAAIFSKIFPGDAGQRLADTFLESLDSNIKNFESAVGDVMPKLAQAENLIASGQRGKNLSLAGDFSKAIDMLARLRETGMPVGHYLNQSTLFERELTPRQERILARFDGVSRSRKGIREVLERYADTVIESPDPRQGGLFGAPEISLDELIERVLQ